VQGTGFFSQHDDFLRDRRVRGRAQDDSEALVSKIAML